MPGGVVKSSAGWRCGSRRGLWLSRCGHVLVADDGGARARARRGGVGHPGAGRGGGDRAAGVVAGPTWMRILGRGWWCGAGRWWGGGPARSSRCAGCGESGRVILGRGAGKVVVDRGSAGAGVLPKRAGRSGGGSCVRPAWCARWAGRRAVAPGVRGFLPRRERAVPGDGGGPAGWRYGGDAAAGRERVLVVSVGMVMGVLGGLVWHRCGRLLGAGEIPRERRVRAAVVSVVVMLVVGGLMSVVDVLV